MVLALSYAQELERLHAGDLCALTRHYNGLQRRFECNQTDEEALEAAFDLFAPQWIANPRFFGAWRAQQGSSYALNLAEACWNFEQALHLRGDGGARTVSDFRWRRIGHYVANARRAALASLEESPRPVMSCVLLGRIERMFSGCCADEDEDFDWYAHGLLLAPESKLLALARLQCLRPEWGGSKGAMQAFVDAQPAELQTALNASKHRFLLHHAAFFEGTPDLIQTHFNAAETLEPGSPWNCFWMAMAESREGDGSEALRWIQRARERAPGSMDLFWNEVEFAGWADRTMYQRERLEEALQLGNFRARRELALLLLREEQPEAAKMRALALLREGHALADPVSSFELAHALGDLQEAAALREALCATEQCAANGDADCALLNVALRIEAKQRPSAGDQVWLVHLRQALAAGLPAAPGRLAQLIERGWVHRSRNGELRVGPALTGVDWKAAFQLRQASAEAGETWQQREVGWCLLQGEGGAKRNVSQGLHWLRCAADAGDAIAQHLLAQQLLHGRHCDQDIAQARLLLELAIEDGLPEARRDRAIADLLGLGEAWGSPEDALQTLAECVEQDHDPVACEALAFIHLQGPGARRDPRAAQRWLRIGSRLDGAGPWMIFQYVRWCMPLPLRRVAGAFELCGFRLRVRAIRFE